MKDQFERHEDGPKHHELKIYPDAYFEVNSFRKTFEIRKNDRDFRRGDVVHLKCWCPEKGYHKLPEICAWISYVTDYEQKEGYVVFTLAGIRCY